MPMKVGIFIFIPIFMQKIAKDERRNHSAD